MKANRKVQKDLIERALSTAKANLLEIEKRTDLTEDEKVSRVNKIMAATCAGVAVQPIPFADFFILTPLQAYMGTRIATIRGVPVSESYAQEVLLEIASVFASGLAFSLARCFFSLSLFSRRSSS